MADPKVQVPALVLRLDKGSELTHEEGDANLKKLRDFSNMLASWLEGALTDEGKLTEKAITDASQLTSRVISADNIKFNSLFFAEDSGSDDNIYEMVIGSEEAESHLKEIPSKTSGEAFVVWLYAKRRCSGPSFLKISKSDTEFHEQIPIRKGANKDLVPADIEADELVCLVFEPTSQTFRIVSGSGSGGTSSSSGDLNFTGLTKYENTVGEDLDATFPSGHTFNHGLNKAPDRTQIYLQCTSADAGYSLGDRVPLSEFIQVSAEPAFTVQITSSQVVVTEAAAASVVDPSTGTLTAITASSWSIYVKGWVYTNVSTVAFPQLQFMATGAGQFVGYNNKLYDWRYQLEGNQYRFYETDILNRAAQRIALTTFDTTANRRYGQAMVWRKGSDEKPYILLIDEQGWHSLLLEAPWTTRTFVTSGNYNHCPVWLDESTGLGGSGNPDLYAIGANHNFRVSDLNMKSIIWNGAAYPAVTNHGSNLDLTHASVINVADFEANIGDAGVHPYAISVQYNPVDAKRRLYVWERNTYNLHVFNLQLYTSNDISAWWTSASRESKLTYEKMINIAPAGYGSNVVKFQRMHVEFDPETGDEIAVWIQNRQNNESVITRTPWVE
jgi:hypothetical protein